MATQARSQTERRPLRRWRAAEARPETDSRLAFVDQALFLGLRATGQAAATQIVWVYDHPIDLAEVRRVHGDFAFGFGGRLIEPSILPFGRHRWVSALGPPAPLYIESQPRDRSELSNWADEIAQRPYDPESGPALHMGVLPMTDGSTAVSMVGSHCIADGGAALLTVYEAIMGLRRDFGYPPPRSRTRREALVADARQTWRDAPELGRTLVTAAKFLNRKRQERAGTTEPKVKRDKVTDAEDTVVVPAVSVFVPIEQWDAKAAELHGNSHSLLAGFIARVAVQQGRQLTADGKVGLIVPINDRTLEDTRANAVKLAYVHVDPEHVATDLSGTRVALREALTVTREQPDETFALLALTPFVPKRAVRLSADLAFGFTAQPVSCSNVGDLPVEVARLDGTSAEQVLLRGVDGRITRKVLEERHGLLTVVSGRLDGKVSFTVVGYQPGVDNTKEGLRKRVATALDEFGLTGVIV